MLVSDIAVFVLKRNVNSNKPSETCKLVMKDENQACTKWSVSTVTVITTYAHSVGRCEANQSSTPV